MHIIFIIYSTLNLHPLENRNFTKTLNKTSIIIITNDLNHFKNKNKD